MKKRKSSIPLIIVFFLGLTILFYPTISNYWNSFHSTKAIGIYSETVSEIDADTYAAVLSDARAYNETLVGRSNAYALSTEQEEQYAKLLNESGTGMMGYIEIETINLKLPIYHTTGEGVLQDAIGHLEWSSLPVGGESTHCVLSGHRGLPGARLFTDLNQLEVGDIFVLRVLNETLYYEVDQITVVEPNDTSELLIADGQDYCTLVTCTPYGINTHRLLVRGHRTEETKMTDAADFPATVEPYVKQNIIVVSVIVLLCVLLKRGISRICRTCRKEKTKKRPVQNKRSKKMKYLKRLIAFILVLVLALASAVSVHAFGQIDQNEKVSLEVRLPDGVRVENIEYRLYLVAEMSEPGELHSTANFRNCRWEKAHLPGSDDWGGSLQLLLVWLNNHPNIQPVDSAKPDTNGVASFPTGGKTLKQGMYLVVAEETGETGCKKIPVPFLICLPYCDADGQWVYAGSVVTKYVATSVSVTKKWSDTGYRVNRPDRVTVSLVYGADGTIYDTVVLNEANNWNHVWNNLPAGYDWSVKEEAVAGYQGTVEKVHGGFVITNTFIQNSIPLTGQLWWPVPLLILVGLFLYTVGYLRYRRNNSHA